MLNGEFKTAYSGKRTVKLFLNILFIACKLSAQVGADFHFLTFILYNADASEYNNAVDSVKTIVKTMPQWHEVTVDRMQEIKPCPIKWQKLKII